MINISLRNSIKIQDEDKSLFITFDYDSSIIKLIKTIKPRHYHYDTKTWELSQSSIHKLIEMFGIESLYIDKDIDLDYVKEKVQINKEDKWSIFKPLLLTMSYDIAKFTIEVLKQVPDYFWIIQTSSSGRYHPRYALGKGGLLRHTLAAGLIAKELFNNETMCANFNNRKKSLMLSAIILHDTFKHGIKECKSTVAEHPIIASNFIKNFKQNIIPKKDVKIIINCIKSHMGEWNKDYKTQKEIMPKPFTEMERFVHLCDYLASRKILEINFDIVKQRRC